jgi:hypothetical protein
MSRRRLLAALGGLAVVGAGAGIACGGGDGGKKTAIPAPRRDEVRMTGLPIEVVARYQFVRNQPELIRGLPCYCGCGDTVDHHHLYDCFVNETGGWAEHASGCNVCLDEAQIAEDMVKAGEKLPAIRERIDREFEGLGRPTGTS